MPSADRILMTADGVGGVWPYALDLSRALGERGFAVDLATMGPALSDSQREAASAVPSLTLHESTFALEWMDDPWRAVSDAGEWLRDVAADTRPGIVHLNGYAHAALKWDAPVVVVGHSCVLSWWRAVHHEDAPAAWGRYYAAVIRGLHSASAVVAPTAAMAAALDTHYGPLADVRVIANGRSCAHQRTVSKEPFVMSAGRLWDAAKNVATLCDVAPRLSWPVVVAGEDCAPDGRAVCPAYVHYLGRLTPEAMQGWMSRASIYALPARYEPFGLSALEAALCGCALVLGDIRSLREVWGDAALYVASDNRRALMAAIEGLIEDEARRSWYASEAQSRAAAYTVDRMADAYVALYDELRTVRVAA